MSRKSDVIFLLVQELKRIIGNDVDTRRTVPHIPYTYKSNVHRDNIFPRFKFIDEINDFPSICLIVGSESRTHIGGGVKYGNLEVQIRGYIKAENALNAADNLLEDIEHTVDSLGNLPDFCPVDIVESRILSLGTDEGLFEPYGVVDVTALIIYEHSEQATNFLGVFTDDFSEDFR